MIDHYLNRMGDRFMELKVREVTGIGFGTYLRDPAYYEDLADRWRTQPLIKTRPSLAA